MMQNRILIIGGVATGAKAAARARRRDPHAKITIVERGRLLSYAGCGMPYYIQGHVRDFHELMSTPAGVIRDGAFFQNVKDIRVLNRTLGERIDRTRKTVSVVNVATGEKAELPYDKLVLATALTFGATIDHLPDLDLGYAPPYSSAVDPPAHAAKVLRNKRDGLAKALTQQQLKAKLDTDEPVVLLDVRTPPERDQMQLRDPRAVWIPLGQLRKRLAELPRDKEIVCFCKVSQRGYEAQRILDGAGFTNVKFLDGALVAWPYPLEASTERKERK